MISLAGLRHATGNLLPAFLWLLILYPSALRLTAAADLLNLAQRGTGLAFSLLVIILFAVRRPRVGRRAKPLGSAIALTGTLGPLGLGLFPSTFQAPDVLALSTVITLVGLSWSIYSLATLGRCFGIFPEVRGLVIRGPYRFVRHPLYLGEMVSAFGVLLPILAWPSLALWLAWLGFQGWRTIEEERILSATFPDYRAYQARTPRLIPPIW